MNRPHKPRIDPEEDRMRVRFTLSGRLLGEDGASFAVMAASMVMTLPVALLFLSMQKLFVGGLTADAKG